MLVNFHFFKVNVLAHSCTIKYNYEYWILDYVFMKIRVCFVEEVENQVQECKLISSVIVYYI